MRRGIPSFIVALLFLIPGGLWGQEPAPVRVTEAGVLLDFQDVDLRLVFTALAEAGGLNVIYTDLPTRRVTLRTNRPVAVEGIAALIRNLAASNGLVVVEEGGFLRIEAPSRLETKAADAEESAASEGEPRLFVYRLKHARAPRLAATLQALFGGRPGTFGSAGGGISGRTFSQQMRQQRVPPFGETAPGGVDVEVAPAPTAPGLPGRLQGEVQIVPDEATNALLVRAQEADWEVVRQAIEMLDLRPLQVLIEVTIAEVRRTRDRALGLTVEATQGDSLVGDFTRAALRGASAGDFALRVLRLGDTNIDVMLNVLAASGDVRILSRPVILAQNNQEAKILIGAERPFIQVFRSLPTGEAIRDQIVQYRDVGTSLTILPTINPDGYVNLQVVQEVSTATSETQFGAPVISTREAATHLFIRDGQTAVLGGLIDRQRDRTQSGIPILKDIPVFGNLFRSTTEFDVQSELFLFLTPHIVATDEDVDRLRRGLEERTEYMKGLRDAVPVIPPDTTSGGAGSRGGGR
jgi:general secretion pathway protein D